MSETLQQGLMAGTGVASRRRMANARWSLAGLAPGLLIGAWIGGGADRYGEDEGVLGGLKGAGRTISRSCEYTSATVRDCMSRDGTSVRNLGLGRKIETRLWQDKRLVAEGILVDVEGQGTAVLRGLVPDAEHKDRAVSLTQQTRGVERVIDQLAVAATSRTLESAPSAAVPTGVATTPRVVR